MTDYDRAQSLQMQVEHSIALEKLNGQHERAKVEGSASKGKLERAVREISDLKRQLKQKQAECQTALLGKSLYWSSLWQGPPSL